MNILRQDLRFGLRALLRQPLFTGAAVLVLALGIGANLAVFSVIYSVLLQPLPYPQPERLVLIRENQTILKRISVSYPNYVDWRAAQRSFTDLALQRTENLNASFLIGGLRVPERLATAQVSAAFFQVLGVRPELGRDFQSSDDLPNAAPVVLISDALWRRRFRADPAAVGRTLKVEGVEREIIGVVPAVARFPRDMDLFLPVADLQADADIQSRDSHPGFSVLGRLKPGVTLGQARQDLTNIALELERRYPETNTGSGVEINTLLEWQVGKFRASLYLLLVAVVCVLLIACANVANLQLARATARQKELAVRAALGASRWRLVRQLLTEGVLLSLFGGVLAVLLALWAVDAIVRLTPENMARFQEIHVNGVVLGFSALLALGTGLLVGIWPAWRMSSTETMARSLHEGNSRGATGGASQQRVRSLLVVAQVALAVVLLAGAGLALKSFYRAQAEKLGFRPDGLLALAVSLPETGYDRTQREEFVTGLLERVRALPGVASAAMGLNIPFDNVAWSQGLHVTGTPPDKPGQSPSVEESFVTPGYFQTMGIALLGGRDFNAQDLATRAPVVVIDEALARTYFPGQNPVGRHLDDGEAKPGEPAAPLEVIGVVAHTRNEAPAETNYLPAAVQMYLPAARSRPVTPNTLLVRAVAGDPLRLHGALRQAVARINADVPVSQVTTMDAMIAKSLGPRRLTMLLLATFAGVALVLASIGLYGVMALTVTQRTRELGIRLALGAPRRAVLALILRQGIVLVGIGLLVGLLAALVAGRLLASVLYGVGGSDPATLGIVAAVLGAAALLACLLPAQRATRVDPMVALRDE